MVAWRSRKMGQEKRSPLRQGYGKGFFWFNRIPDVIRSVIFKGAVTVVHYGLDFYRVCGSCRKPLFPVCQIEVFRIIQGGGSREIIPADPAGISFFSLRDRRSRNVFKSKSKPTFSMCHQKSERVIGILQNPKRGLESLTLLFLVE